MVKCQIGKMSNWQNIKLAKCQVGTTSWPNIKQAKLEVGKMSSWSNDKQAKCQVGQMTSWPNDKLLKCQINEDKLFKSQVGKCQVVVRNPFGP